MRRVVIAGALLVAFVAVFVVKLVEIQVVRADEYNAEAEQVRSVENTVYGARGDIVDANGTVLAGSVMRYEVTVSPAQAQAGEADDPGQLARGAADLGAAIGIPAEQITGAIAAALAADPDDNWELVAKQVDIASYDKIKALGIPWVYTDPRPGRTYPNGAVAGNLIGFVQADNGEPQAGLELAQDQCLAGVDGKTTALHSLEDWVDIPGSERTIKQAEPGSTLVLATAIVDRPRVAGRIEDALARGVHVRVHISGPTVTPVENRISTAVEASADTLSAFSRCVPGCSASWRAAGVPKALVMTSDTSGAWVGRYDANRRLDVAILDKPAKVAIATGPVALGKGATLLSAME